MSIAYEPRQNHLLAALPVTEFERLKSRLTLVHLPHGQVLNEPGDQLRRIFFPITATVSLLSIMSNGASAEIAIVGNDGVLGIAQLMGGETVLNRAVVQGAGYAYRLTSETLKDEFNRAGALQRLLLRYTQALLTQIAQTAVCNRHHTLEQRMCRWLLLSLDRAYGSELFMTHESFAHTLGVRREGVTAAAVKLQAAGLITYTRGHIVVLNRAGLEARSCECYAAVKKETDRLLPAPGRLGLQA